MLVLYLNRTINNQKTTSTIIQPVKSICKHTSQRYTKKKLTGTVLLHSCIRKGCSTFMRMAETKIVITKQFRHSYHTCIFVDDYNKPDAQFVMLWHIVVKFDFPFIEKNLRLHDAQNNWLSHMPVYSVHYRTNQEHEWSRNNWRLNEGATSDADSCV